MNKQIFTCWLKFIKIMNLHKPLIYILFLFFLTGCQDEKEKARPNILFIIADDASKRSFGAYGSTSTKTPAFDSLAKEGVTFTNAYNNNPKCSPARAAILTGRYSWQLEEAANHRPYLDDRWKYYPFIL
jgi:arylsulfatase A-like enzyme